MDYNFHYSKLYHWIMQFKSFHWLSHHGLSVLSISFEVDVPTGKVGGCLLFERQRRKLLRGVWGRAPRTLWNLDAWKCYFQRFPDSILALRTIKIEAILTIFYVYVNRSFPWSLNHQEPPAIIEFEKKSEMINLQMLILKKYIHCLKFMLFFWKKRAQQCLFPDPSIQTFTLPPKG